MRAHSAASHKAGLDLLVSELSNDNPERVATELFEFTDVLRENTSLLNACTDPSRSPADKQKLVRDILGDQASKATVKAVEKLVSGRWSDEADLAESIEQLGVRALLESALSEEDLDRVEAELFAIRNFLRTNRDVRSALSDHRGYHYKARAELSRKLFGEYLHPATMTLISRVVAHVGFGRLLWTIRDLALECAELRNRDLVVVTCAKEPSQSQLAKLRQILVAMTGRELTLNVSIDPELIGGMQIKLGDSRIDGSLLKNLTRVRRRISL